MDDRCCETCANCIEKCNGAFLLCKELDMCVTKWFLCDKYERKIERTGCEHR